MLCIIFKKKEENEGENWKVSRYYKAYALDKNGLKGSFWINRWDENANMMFWGKSNLFWSDFRYNFMWFIFIYPSIYILYVYILFVQIIK